MNLYLFAPGWSMKHLKSQIAMLEESKTRDVDMNCFAPTIIFMQTIKDSQAQAKDIEEYISSKNKV